MVTIKMIAEKAGVSIATVSRVLNNDKTMSVNPQTRQNIFNIAEELGYTKYKKNLLSKQKRKRIAIMQWYTKAEEFNDLYYYAIRIGIERKAMELGYDIVRLFHKDNLDQLQGVDGIIAVGKYSKKQIKQFESFSDHLVFVDSDTLNDGHSCVTTDFKHAVYNSLDHFIENGLTKIGILVGEERTEDREEMLIDPRFSAFKQYLTAKKLYRSDYVFIGHFSIEDGYRLMKEAIVSQEQDFPQAFFIASDTMAIGALRALQEAGYRVPEDVSLISFNDTPIAKQVYPALSCVTVFTEEMGMAAMDTLDRHLHSFAPQVPTMLQLATSLTLRESSKNK